MSNRALRRLLGIRSPSGAYVDSLHPPAGRSYADGLPKGPQPTKKEVSMSSTPDINIAPRGADVSPKDVSDAVHKAMLAEAHGVTETGGSIMVGKMSVDQFASSLSRPPKAGHYLKVAKETIEGPREQEYGNKTENFQRIADLWSPIFGIKVTREQVAMAMNQVKISRLVNSPGHVDSWVDAIGYMAIGAEVREARDGKS